VPHHADDYVHRVGRTGRAGRTGHAITIVSPADRKSLAAIEKLTGQTLAWAGEPAASAEAPESRPREPRGHRPPRDRAPHHARAPAPAPAPRREEAPAPRREEARPPRVRESEHADISEHLPAFLLRPVHAKA
jgi:superfamily II DNA/RNA helicase